jgi:hypothetical protein
MLDITIIMGLFLSKVTIVRDSPCVVQRTSSEIMIAQTTP